MERPQLIPLVGAMMGASNDVSEHLADIAYPARVTKFLRKLERQSFGKAGVYRGRGYADPGAWCFFTVSKWVTLTKLDKYQLLHIRKRLVDDGIIHYLPNLTGERDLDDDLADGRIFWNLTFFEWKPLQLGYVAPKQGGIRPGAGRPRKKQLAIANLISEQGSIANLNNDTQQQAAIANLISDSRGNQAQEEAAQTLPGSGASHPDNVVPFTIKNNSNLQCTPAYDAQNNSKFAMAASHEEAPEQAAKNAPSYPTKERRRRKKGELLANQDGLPGMGFTEEEQFLLDVLRELPTHAPNSKRDAHLIRALVYTEKYPIAWLKRQANFMIDWALKNPGKRRFDQGYFIQWCGFDAAQKDLLRWKQQQEALYKVAPPEESQQSITFKSVDEQTADDARILAQQEARRRERYGW